MENPSNIQPDQVIVVEGDAGFVPKAEPSDAGKVLGVVNASGDVGWVEASGGQLTQVQADWAETDPTQVSYIDNKPDLSVYAQSANLATVATTGDYDDLVNKPSIPAAQVNSDWSASSGVAAILNKPSLAAVATTGDYDDLVNKPSIPAAQVNADWNASSGVSEILNKPSLATVATTGAYSDLTGTPAIPTVDQTYDASSTNAQSGVAVASAISGVNAVPASTSVDSGKILAVDSQGAPVWSNAGGTFEIIEWSSATYNLVKAAYDAGKQPVILDKTTYSSQPLYGYLVTTEMDPFFPTRVDSFRFLSLKSIGSYFPSDQSATVVRYIVPNGGQKSSSEVKVAAKFTADSSVTLTQDGISQIKIAVANPLPASTPAEADKVLTVGSSGTPVWAAAQGGTVDQTYNASSTNAQSGTAVAGALATVNQVPASTSADEDKVLTVNSSGNPVWAASSAPASKPLVAGANITITDGANDVTIAATATTVDQTYDASSTNAQSGVAVASAISGISQVPASTSADADKVLTVNSSGTPVWAESQGGGGGGGTTVDYTDDSYWETVLKSKIVATDSCYAILKFADASYDPSAVSDVTSVFTVTRLSEYSENVWLFERPSSVTSNEFLSSTLITVNYEILSLAYNAPSIGVDFNFVKDYRCTRIGNIFPVPGSSYSTLYARFYITYGSTSVKSIGLIDLSFFRGPSVEWKVGYSYASDVTVSNLPITSIGGVVAYSWSSMRFENTFARTKITKAPPFYRYGSGNVLVRENEISPATIDAMFQGCDQMTEIDTVLTLQSVTNTPDYGTTYNNRYCFEGCRKLSKVAGVKITVYNGASYKPLSLVNMFSLCESLTYNPLILSYAPASGDSSTMHAIYLDKLFAKSGIENYLGAIRCAYNTNWKPVSLESLATTTTSMFEGAYKLTNVSMCFGNESSFYVTKTKVDNMFKYCAALKDTAKLYASLNSVISPSATSSDTQGAFTNAGAFAPDYTTNQSQIPSSWGGTGA